MKLVIIKILIFMICSSLFGQTYNVKLRKSAKLETIDASHENQVYVKSVINNNSEVIDIYLINQSKDSISIDCGYKGDIGFQKEGRDIQKKWKKMDTFTGYCDTGSDIEIITKLPPNHYTWQRIPLWQINDGNFDTQIRFKFRLKDSMLISNPIKAKIDFFRLFPSSIGQFKVNEELTNETDLTDIQVQNYSISKGSIYLYFKQFDEAIKLSKLVLKKYPENHEAKSLLARALLEKLAYVESTVGMYEISKIGVVSKIIQLLKEIPTNHSKYEVSQNRISSCEKYLNSVKGIRNLLKNECKEISNGIEYECEIKSFLNETVNVKLEK